MYEKIMKLLKYNEFRIVLHLDNIIMPIGAHLSTSLGHKSQITVKNVPKTEENDLFQFDNQYQIDEDPSPYCQSTLKSLTTGQKQICLLHADHMPIVVQGKILFFCLAHMLLFIKFIKSTKPHEKLREKLIKLSIFIISKSKQLLGRIWLGTKFLMNEIIML